MKKQIRIYIYIIGLILIDQLSKVWALSALRGTEGIVVIPNVFELSYLENRGAAFGILQDHQIFFFQPFQFFILSSGEPSPRLCDFIRKYSELLAPLHASLLPLCG